MSKKSNASALADALAAPAAPWPDLDTLPPIPEKARERFLDRLEAAWADGTLRVSPEVYEQILCAILEEEFRLEAAGVPDQSPPGSALRKETYRRRALGGAIFITADRPALQGDSREGQVDREAVIARDRGNHTGVVPMGWGTPEDEPEPIAVGMYASADGVMFELLAA